MKKQIFKNVGGTFLCWMGLTAVVCVPSFIAGVTYVNSGGPVASPDATTTGSENGIQPQPVESAAVLVQAEQPAQWPTAPMNANNITASDHKTQLNDTILPASEDTLQLRAQHVGMKVSNR